MDGTNRAESSSDAQQNKDTAPHVWKFDPPGEVEAKLYYACLPSRPLLLGRTTYKRRPWQWFYGPYESGLKTYMRPIGPHKIKEKWEEILPRVMGEGVSGLPWTSIDLFRMGHPDAPREECPVVVWVGVYEKDKTTGDCKVIPWEDIHTAMVKCKEILDSVDLDDVEVEIRVSQVFPLVADISDS